MTCGELQLTRGSIRPCEEVPWSVAPRDGRHLQGLRSEFVLSTKCGYGVPGMEDWMPECITRGVDQALMRLRTDVLDVVHFQGKGPRGRLLR
ncbi:hypothetical protein BHS05_26340 [Myxococcus xanthus]|nr:hypothetical protein BHS05_26340 [Myxococcus xanthus]